MMKTNTENQSKPQTEICDVCKKPITEEEEKSERTIVCKDRTKKIIYYHSDCQDGLKEEYNNWCDLCGCYYEENNDTFNITYKEFKTNRMTSDVICSVCLSEPVFHKKYDVLAINEEGVEITPDMMKKVNKELTISPTYAVRFMSLKGIIGMTLHFGEEFMGEKYQLARQSLDQYGFNSNNVIAYEQLIEIVNQLTKK